ncbi:hypothetical protein LguiB_006025 [Lonicera macranthoides]
MVARAMSTTLCGGMVAQRGHPTSESGGSLEIHISKKWSLIKYEAFWGLTGFESHKNSEVKRAWARAIPGLVTPWEAGRELPETNPSGVERDAKGMFYAGSLGIWHSTPNIFFSVWKEGKKEEITMVVDIAKRCLKLSGRKTPTMRDVMMELEGIRIPNGGSGINELDEEGEYDIIEVFVPSETSSTSRACPNSHLLLIE